VHAQRPVRCRCVRVACRARGDICSCRRWQAWRGRAAAGAPDGAAPAQGKRRPMPAGLAAITEEAEDAAGLAELRAGGFLGAEAAAAAASALEAEPGARRLRRTITHTAPDGAVTTRELIYTHPDKARGRGRAAPCVRAWPVRPMRSRGPCMRRAVRLSACCSEAARRPAARPPLRMCGAAAHVRRESSWRALGRPAPHRRLLRVRRRADWVPA